MSALLKKSSNAPNSGHAKRFIEAEMEQLLLLATEANWLMNS